MDNPHYNHIKATSNRVHSEICLRSALLEACQSKNVQSSAKRYEIADNFKVCINEFLVLFNFNEAARQILTIIVLLASVLYACAQNGIAQRVLPKLKQSVLTVYAENEDGYNFSRGSGFFISSTGVGVTNYHVLDGAYSGYVKDSKGQTFRIKGIVDYSPTMDLVKFSVEKSPNQKITPLTISQKSPRQGEEIISYSTPLGVFENTVSTGIVSSIRNMQGYGSVVQITAPLSQGSSGSPIVNSHVLVVGIATFGYESGQSLNFAVNAIQLKKLNRTLNIPVGEMSRSSLETARVKLAKRYAQNGDYTNAVAFLTKEIDFNPNNDLAYYYRGVYRCRSNQYSHGLDDIEKACELDTTNIAYYVKFGTFLRNVAIMQWNKSHEISEELINLAAYVAKHSMKLDPSRGEPLADYGYILFYMAHQKNGTINRDVLNDAKQLLDLAILVAPIVENYSIRGEINTKLKNLGEALLDYDKVIALAPNYYRGYEMRGDIKIFEFNQIDDGLLDIERAYSLADRNDYKADCLGLKAAALEKKAFLLPPDAATLIGMALKAYNEAYELTKDESYIALKNKMANRVKAYIKTHGRFP